MLVSQTGVSFGTRISQNVVFAESNIQAGIQMANNDLYNNGVNDDLYIKQTGLCVPYCNVTSINPTNPQPRLFISTDWFGLNGITEKVENLANKTPEEVRDWIKEVYRYLTRK